MLPVRECAGAGENIRGLTAGRGTFHDWSCGGLVGGMGGGGGIFPGKKGRVLPVKPGLSTACPSSMVGVVKRIFLLLVAMVCGLGGAVAARADHVLIYNGYQDRRTNGGPASLTRYYVIFDVDTLEYNTVQYLVLAGHKTTQSEGPIAFEVAPIKVTAAVSQSIFVTGTASMGANFDMQLTTFAGTNAVLVLGGGFTGKYPRILTYSSRTIDGVESPASGTSYVDSGVYSLNTHLTTYSNEHDYDFAAATALVTTYLGALGY